MKASLANEPARKGGATAKQAVQQALEQAEKPKALITISEGRPQFPVRAEREFGIGPAEWRVLVDAIFPTAKTIEGVVTALAYCRARNLDIMKRPVHVVPMWNSKLGREVETVWPGISELRTTATRTNLYAGKDETQFGPEVLREFSGEVRGKGMLVKVTFPAWAQVTVYRLVGGQRCAFVGPKVFWLESYARRGKSEVPNDMWEKRPFGQLDKCAEAAALRTAFPEEIGNELTAEEMQGRETDITPTPVEITAPSPPPAEEQPVEGEVVDDEPAPTPPAEEPNAIDEVFDAMEAESGAEGEPKPKEEEEPDASMFDEPTISESEAIDLAELAAARLKGGVKQLRESIRKQYGIELEALPQSELARVIKWLNDPRHKKG